MDRKAPGHPGAGLETMAALALLLLGAGAFFGDRRILFAAAIPLAAGLFLPRTCDRLAGRFLALGRRIGEANAKVLLAVVFFALLVPLAVIARRLGGGRLGIRLDRGRPSHWEERDHVFRPEDLENPW